MSAIFVSTAVFLVSLGLIFSEKVNRTIVALAGAALMVGLGMVWVLHGRRCRRRG
jgi:Na+/H+ antiporter NhaD/arsenite permease-like protein